MKTKLTQYSVHTHKNNQQQGQRRDSKTKNQKENEEIDRIRITKTRIPLGKQNMNFTTLHSSNTCISSVVPPTAGWGRISGQTNQLASQLQQSKVPVVDHATCTRKNGGVHETSMVCAGGAGSSACNGDSGGPLVCQEEGRWVLRGAASWVTAKTCPGHTYSVYARISSFVNWINQQAGGV